MQFLGSVEVPYHQGNGILCAAMQKVRPGQGAGGVDPSSPRWREPPPPPLMIPPLVPPRLPPPGS